MEEQHSDLVRLPKHKLKVSFTFGGYARIADSAECELLDSR